MGQGTETVLPSRFVRVKTVKYSGLSFKSVESPLKNDPSPRAESPRNGIASPPISSPTPLIVSLTATDFNPPKIAYALPRLPINKMMNHKGIFKSNILFSASDPV